MKKVGIQTEPRPFDTIPSVLRHEINLPSWRKQGRLHAIFLVELLNTSAGGSGLLLSRIERMAFGTNLNVDFLLGRTYRKGIPAVAGHLCLIIIRMDSFSHFLSPRLWIPFDQFPIDQQRDYHSTAVKLSQVRLVADGAMSILWRQCSGLVTAMQCPSCGKLCTFPCFSYFAEVRHG